MKKCSVVNCRKELRDNEAIIIGNRVYCKECGILLNKMFIEHLARGR